MNHQPVMVREILDHVQYIQNVRWILDGTLGYGGHALILRNRFPLANVMAFDQDLETIRQAQKKFSNQKNFYIYHQNFHQFEKKKGELFLKHSLKKGFDLILLDLGVNSAQLDNPQRGFSFYHDGPLDMRMDVENPISASLIINHWDEEDLLDLFKNLGEILDPRSVVRSIIKSRKNSPIETTGQLAHLIVKKLGWKKKGRHPATSYFRALRIQVNNELTGLQKSLPFLIDSLNFEGRILVLTFHSLEDRIVKRIFKDSYLKKEGFLVNKKVIRPTRKEILSNPRSRSAKLRIFEKKARTV